MNITPKRRRRLLKMIQGAMRLIESEAEPFSCNAIEEVAEKMRPPLPDMRFEYAGTTDRFMDDHGCISIEDFGNPYLPEGKECRLMWLAWLFQLIDCGELKTFGYEPIP